MKIDLVMWTLNGEKTLFPCLKSIEKAIPENIRGQKIVVDGHSSDNTKAICESFGWTVFNAIKRGIPFQQNQALKYVKTDLFASFEQDIILNPEWFSKISCYLERRDVAVAQGIRISVNYLMRLIELEALPTWSDYVSVDNNIYRTSIIKNIGGFNVNCPFAADRELQNRIQLKTNFKWVVDKSVVSKHNKPSFINHSRKAYRDVKTSVYVKNSVSFKSVLATFGFSPFRGLSMALKTGRPDLILAYPYYRLHHVLGYFA